jgi:murein L,D-transpeptidase YcbB/YkuD
MKHLFYISCIVLLFASCKNVIKQANGEVVPRDYTIDTSIAVTDMYLDSTAMEQFISKQQFHDSLSKRIRSFYNGRNYQYAWFNSQGMSTDAGTFIDLFNDYISYSRDSSLYNPVFTHLYDSITGGNYQFRMQDSIVFQTELLLTAQFFRYAYRKYQGSNTVNTRQLEWYIPRKRINSVAVLDSMLAHKDEKISELEPVHQQYKLLKDYLVKYYEIEKQGGWQQIKPDKKKYQLHDESPVISRIKHRLFLSGDLKTDDTSDLFNETTLAAVKQFQHRYGLKEDGIINNAVITEMNRPVQERLTQILINMERLRWLPAQPASDFLLVNIPEYRLHVFEKGNYNFSMDVVVGTAANNTVIFQGTLKYIVFSPYWNVPSSILRNEILPALRRNKNYLNKNHMEWNGNAVRQKPGAWNSLGLVKFLFPNSYSIYLHDTPSKSKFDESKRAFSHGCIRLSQPKKLAEYLLRNEKEWTSQKIDEAMNAGKEKYLNIKEPIPVYIVYLTAFVDANGQLNFRNDVYGHDEKMEAQLFRKNN